MSLLKSKIKQDKHEWPDWIRQIINNILCLLLFTYW